MFSSISAQLSYTVPLT